MSYEDLVRRVSEEVQRRIVEKEDCSKVKVLDSVMTELGSHLNSEEYKDVRHKVFDFLLRSRFAERGLNTDLIFNPTERDPVATLMSEKQTRRRRHVDIPNFLDALEERHDEIHLDQAS